MRDFGAFLKDAWRLSRRYFWSEERWSARGLLLAVVLLNAAMIGLTVLLVTITAIEFDAFQNKDMQGFISLMLWFGHTASGQVIPGAVMAAVLQAAAGAGATYVQQVLQIRWRRWLTAQVTADWLAGRAYYGIGLLPLNRNGTDNPDQRIQEDIGSYITDTLTLGLGLFTSLGTAASFFGVLWSLSSDYRVFGTAVPGYLVWAALLYAVVNLVAAHFVGRPLTGLDFTRQRVEADFRFGLVRVRENAEGVALHGGETLESEQPRPALWQRGRQLRADHTAHRMPELHGDRLHAAGVDLRHAPVRPGVLRRVGDTGWPGAGGLLVQPGAGKSRLARDLLRRHRVLAGRGRASRAVRARDRRCPRRDGGRRARRGPGH